MSNSYSEYKIPDMIPELERGPVWLKEQRRTSCDDFNALPLPRRGLHLWRYTDPAEFICEQTTDAASTSDRFEAIVKTERAHLEEGRLAGLVTDVGGRDITVYGLDDIAKRGVIVAPLSAAVESHIQLVEPYLYGLVSSRTGKFEAMNGALWYDGVFIYVPDNVTLEQPIHLLRETGGAGSGQFPRLLVIVGRNAELTLIDEYSGGAVDGDASHSHTNGAVEIFGLDNSRTRYISLQRLAGEAKFYQTHRAKIGQGATMLTIPLAFGGSLSKQNFGVIMNGAGAESKMYGLVFGSRYQHFDNHTLHHHVSGNTFSHIDLKVVLRDKALSAYTGLIRIEQAARTCEAYQENRNLLLNRGTRAETIPELEILNEDVSCSHGATIGPIDPLLTFYLNSRGIPPTEAVRMVVSGFVASTLKLVPPDLQERISDFVIRRLEDI